LRAYKQESELEIWKQNAAGQYVHLKTYPMCRWSGQLGPKVREGDRQVPEGFYTITEFAEPQFELLSQRSTSAIPTPMTARTAARAR
jgi:murein L,D-transpeptidase YafK